MRQNQSVFTSFPLLVRLILFLLLLGAALFSVSPATAENRVLLIACREFETMPDLGASVSGNLALLKNTFLNSGIPETDIRIEDGTLGTVDALRDCLTETFGNSTQADLSIIYLCTHGIARTESQSAHLIFSDGSTESMLDGPMLLDLLSPIQGDVLLLIDACHSGALIGLGLQDECPPVLPDHLHVITSSLGSESAWYYAHDQMESGAVSYFAEGLCSGLGLYGQLNADINGDDDVSLSELAAWLRRTVASSTCQLISSRAGTMAVPHCVPGMPEKPIRGFFCGSQLISNSNTSFHFSFTVIREARIEYRLIPYTDDHWDWANPIIVRDSETTEIIGRGAKTRTLSIDPANRAKNGYLIFQIFAYEEDNIPQLCAERLLAIQSENDTEAELSLTFPESEIPANPGASTSVPFHFHISIPTVFRVSVYDGNGCEIRRLYYGELTRPASDNTQILSWDLRDDTGMPIPTGTYTVEVLAFVLGDRIQSTAQLVIE